MHRSDRADERAAITAVLLLALVLACGRGGAPVAATAQSATPARPTPSAAVIVDAFERALAPEYEPAPREAAEPYPLTDEGPQPRRIIARSFRALAPAEGAPRGVRLSFVLRVYEYTSRATAADAFGRLRAEVDESMLYKSPMLVVQQGSRIVRLDGGCVFSEPRWAEIEAALDDVLSSSSSEHGSRLRVRCGGQVVESATRERDGR